MARRSLRRPPSFWALLGGALVLGFVIGLVTAPTFACNDGSTGCCVVCQGTCPCGDACAPCGQICTRPKGCACTSTGESAFAAGAADAPAGAPPR